MNAEQALKITVETVHLDATLLGEPVNLNRVTFWLSELHYGRKWTGPTWSHCVPRDIIKHAANIAETHSGVAQILALASAAAAASRIASTFPRMTTASSGFVALPWAASAAMRSAVAFSSATRRCTSIVSIVCAYFLLRFKLEMS